MYARLSIPNKPWRFAFSHKFDVMLYTVSKQINVNDASLYRMKNKSAIDSYQVAWCSG